MHFYEDKDGSHKVHNNELVITAYLSEVLGKEPEKLEWDLMSIQSVRLLPPFQLQKFLECFNYIFPLKAKKEDFEKEKWYLFKLKFVDYEPHDFEIISFEDITLSTDDELKAH